MSICEPRRKGRQSCLHTSAPCPGSTPPWPSVKGRETSSRSWQAWCRADRNQAAKSAFEPSKAQKRQRLLHPKMLTVSLVLPQKRHVAGHWRQAEYMPPAWAQGL